ncbi:hypothetical protein DY052_07580 [Apilactobacillus timberlakei]|nr:hypothetical protein DY052_07580 [Apilactobacillus timberlakei]
MNLPILLNIINILLMIYFVITFALKNIFSIYFKKIKYNLLFVVLALLIDLIAASMLFIPYGNNLYRLYCFVMEISNINLLFNVSCIVLIISFIVKVYKTIKLNKNVEYKNIKVFISMNKANIKFAIYNLILLLLTNILPIIIFNIYHMIQK